MDVKFFTSVKFVFIKREFIIKKVYLMYSGFKEHCYRMIAVTATTLSSCS